jgi:1,4-dihydroxy-2-naphthoate octaprenyltransferase
LRVVSLVRYRFFLYAGLLPYLLGAAWAYAIEGQFDAAVFWSGLGGVVLAVVGVEAFNEYFDAQMGTDRVFNPVDLPPISVAVFWIGVAAFAGALAVGVYLTLRGGWPILAFALLGGAAAIFYEAPPVRWSYRGLGEPSSRCRTDHGWCLAASTSTLMTSRSARCWHRWSRVC